MDIFKIAVIGICGVVLSSMVKGYKPEMAIYIVISTVLLLFGYILYHLTAVFDLFSGVYGQIRYGKAFFPVVVKVLVVGYIADFTAQLCRDAGEGAIAGKVELAGKVMIFYLAVPIMMSLLEIVTKLLPS
ncbi:SpoIIIAC/SpoIIIAD family protein [Bacilliculturomica massiliensis]|uniref:SpoIIIAC/SpoIIIAD family protein n=1 Tax=Bacilliculturomica massiliensis TaxID=1917867 RepID=UPI0012B8528A|nr:SpoIIIAC/SpoIIIAD family protein [Bacilliculturomica massiliensis]